LVQRFRGSRVQRFRVQRFRGSEVQGFRGSGFWGSGLSEAADLQSLLVRRAASFIEKETLAMKFQMRIN